VGLGRVVVVGVIFCEKQWQPKFGRKYNGEEHFLEILLQVGNNYL